MAEMFAGPVTAIRPWGAGHINDTYLVDGAAGEYVVQRINTAVFPDSGGLTANIITVHRHLRGAFVPEPVPASDGAWLVQDGNGPWRAWRRAPGAPLTAAAASVGALWSAGALLGRFHGALEDLDAAELTETLPSFHNPAGRLDALRTVIAADPCGRVATAQPEIAAAWEAESLVGVAEELTATVPRRVAHFDAKLDNILFDGDEASCLLDLDTLMPGAWFWDVGDLLRSGATTAAEDDPDPDRAVAVPERYEAILAGYRDGLGAGGIDAALDLAGAIVTYEQAVRFLTDWIAGDVYYRTSRPGHNLDRARNQFRLLASMPRP